MSQAKIIEVDNRSAGQRIDNFLVRELKGVPKTRLYKAIRKGEVRVNGGRVKALYNLKTGDRVRIPPIRFSQSENDLVIPPRLKQQIPVLFEDDHLLVINKPSGIAVHGGTGQAFGIIDIFRDKQSDNFLELAHRLDRGTSGCLILAKNRKALLAVQQQLINHQSIRKNYLCLVAGDPRWQAKSVTLCLKVNPAGSQTTKKKVVTDPDGQAARTDFQVDTRYGKYALLRAKLFTGRMHQVRVHTSSQGHPIIGDDLYGDFEKNREAKSMGLGRLFLHASDLKFKHPENDQEIEVHASLPGALKTFLDNLDTAR